PNNLNDVVEIGGSRVAVVRSIMQAEQPTLVTQYFLSQLHHVQKVSSNSKPKVYEQS
ncbi:MAG: thiamine phosphate synthase, partial [Cyanobacteria bacterium J06643_5]